MRDVVINKIEEIRQDIKKQTPFLEKNIKNAGNIEIVERDDSLGHYKVIYKPETIEGTEEHNALLCTDRGYLLDYISEKLDAGAYRVQGYASLAGIESDMKKEFKTFGVSLKGTEIKYKSDNTPVIVYDLYIDIDRIPIEDTDVEEFISKALENKQKSLKITYLGNDLIDLLTPELFLDDDESVKTAFELALNLNIRDEEIKEVLETNVFDSIKEFYKQYIPLHIVFENSVFKLRKNTYTYYKEECENWLVAYSNDKVYIPTIEKGLRIYDKNRLTILGYYDPEFDELIGTPLEIIENVV